MSSILLILAFFTPHEPDATDLIRFPPYAVAVDCKRQASEAEALFRWLWAMEPPYSARAEWYALAISDAHQAFDAWEDLVNAHEGSDKCLCLLKAVLPPLQWRTGQMPQPIPAWAFTD